jgi:hypothetical protein
MRWYVQVEARFAHAHDVWIEEAVAHHLMEAGVIHPDADSVHGDPGPRIFAGITVDADAAESAASAAGGMLAEALGAAGVEADTYVLEVGHARASRGKWWSPEDRLPRSQPW